MASKLHILGVSGQARSGKDTVAKHLKDTYGYFQLSLADPIKALGYQVFGFSVEQLWGPSEFRNKLDKRYKQYEKNGAKDAAWALASKRLGEHGRTWIANVVNLEPDSEEVNRYHAKLLQWFQWLGRYHSELSPRIMLQTLGTEWGREYIDADIWVNYMLRSAEKVLLDGKMYDRLQGVTEEQNPESVPGVIVSDVRFDNELKAIKDRGGLLIRVVREETDEEAQLTGVSYHPSETEQTQFEQSVFDFIVNNNKTIEELKLAIDTFALAKKV